MEVGGALLFRSVLRSVFLLVLGIILRFDDCVCRHLLCLREIAADSVPVKTILSGQHNGVSIFNGNRLLANHIVVDGGAIAALVTIHKCITTHV